MPTSSINTQNKARLSCVAFNAANCVLRFDHQAGEADRTNGLEINLESYSRSVLERMYLLAMRLQAETDAGGRPHAGRMEVSTLPFQESDELLIAPIAETG